MGDVASLIDRYGEKSGRPVDLQRIRFHTASFMTAAVMGAVILGQIPTVLEVCGIALVVAASALRSHRAPAASPGA